MTNDTFASSQGWSSRLIVFTRYPEVGRAKTRLIPALGSHGATELHRQMVEHTIAQVKGVSQWLSIEVRFVGGDRELMQHWLGDDLDYRPQAEGDLGMRLWQASQQAFLEGASKVLMIGTDCPELDANKLRQALRLLDQHDLVLGPALDGGYYLMGLRRLAPELFENILWSTAAVLKQTVQIAETLGLTIALLTPLADVDYPEDLPIWERVQTRVMPIPTAKISVILPVLNEAGRIAGCLDRLLATPGLEIIVVDGGSQDQTRAIAREKPVISLLSSTGRAGQMNAGARVATDSILIFLHADTQLPDNFDQLVIETLGQPGVVAGAFDLRIDGSEVGLRWVEWGVKWRSRLLQMPYGDQALFMKAHTFEQIGGFPEIPLMEDFELVRRLKRMGKVAIAPASVLTSGRRWKQLGIWKTTAINQAIILAYLVGVAPDKLSRWYRQSAKP